MPRDPIIRSIRPDELRHAIALATRVIDGTYGAISFALRHALTSDPIPIVGDAAYWRHCLVALVGGRLVGVALAKGDRLEDLWIDSQWQRQRLGSQLLAAAEQQITAAGHRTAFLNVVQQNAAAIHFYVEAGWIPGPSYLHDKWGFEMLRMSKHLP